MPQLFRKLRAFFTGREPLVFVAALVIVAGVWAFVELLEHARGNGGGPTAFDTFLLKFFRRPDNRGVLIGPAWLGLESIVRDVTALGGVVVLGMVVVFVAGFLHLTRRYHLMWLVLAASIGASVVNQTAKDLVRRDRPVVVPQLTKAGGESFPSGHSAMSAAVYLTLGGLLAQTVNRRRVKLYFLAIAMLLTFMIGLSRVMLGVHYPTDVLAGWTTGLVWALLCWLVARYLQRRGAIEKEEDPTAKAAPPESTA